MAEKRMEDMIHEDLLSGVCITQAEGNDQELIMDFMSKTGSLGNFDLLHMYLVVSRTHIKFGKELSTIQRLQKVINDGNQKFVIDSNFVEG